MAKADTKKKPAKKKGGGVKGLARKLTNAEYAGSIEQVLRNKGTNRRQYEEYVPQRQDSLAKQIGSDQLASQITQNTIGGLKDQALAEFKRSAAASEATRNARDSANAAVNTQALTNYEAEMKARGLDTGQVENMKQSFNTQQGYSAKLDEIARNAATGAEQRAGSLYDTLKVQAAMAGNSAEANARADAQSDFNEKFNTYTTTRDQLAGELVKLKKDRGSAYLNTYLTLKKEAEQRAAERAAGELSAARAMGEQASSDYFAQIRADQNQQKIDISRGGGDLKRQQFLESVQKRVDSGTVNWAKVWLDAKKAGIELPPEWAQQAGASRKKRNYTYYDPRSKSKNKLTKSYS